jgi:acetyl esterase/lipase
MIFNSDLRPIIALTTLACTLLLQPTFGDDQARGKDRYAIRKGLRFSETALELKLDLYVPTEATKPTACIIVIQGGGFKPQNGERFRPFAIYLAEHGFAAALISYRGRPDHKYQDTIADTKSAVRYVRKVSGQHNIDPDRIGAMGRSAGGTLAGLLAVTGDGKEFDSAGDHPHFSSRIQAAVAFAGVFDFIGRFTDQRQIDLQPGHRTKIQTNGEWIGPPFSPDNEHWRSASAITHVDENDAPVLFIHCKDDATVPWIQSQHMHERLKAAGVRSAIKYYNTGGHGFRGLGETPMDDMVRFFRETL